MNFWTKLNKIPNILAILFIRFYRFTLSPSVGILRFLPFYPKPSCIFYPTCSEYGIICYQKLPFFKATIKTLNRISRCHPFNEPKIDKPF